MALSVTPTLDKAQLGNLLQSAGYMDEDKYSILAEVVKKKEKQQLQSEAEEFVDKTGLGAAKTMLYVNSQIRELPNQVQAEDNGALEMLKQLIQGQIDTKPEPAPEQKKFGIFEETAGNYKTRLEAEKIKRELGSSTVDAQSMKALTDVAVKELEFKMKGKEEGNLKPEHILNKFEPVANAYQSIVDSYDRVVQSAKEPSAAGDLALIFNYMKILDPGSTVREGEFATAQNSAGLPERLRAVYNSTINGKRLGDDQRNDFVKRAEMLFSAREKQYLASEKEFTTLAEKNKIDPDKVLRKVRRSPEEITQTKSKFTPEEIQAEIKRRGLNG